MQKIRQHEQESSLIHILILIILGGWLTFSPRSAFHTLIYFLALTLVVEGIIRLRVGRQVERATGDRNPYYGGISLLILAVILLLFAKPLASLLPVVLGILLIVYGLQKLGFARRNQRFVNVTPWPAYVYGILVLLLGAVVLFHPFGSLLFLLRGVGIVMCIMAISEIIGLFIYKN